MAKKMEVKDSNAGIEFIDVNGMELGEIDYNSERNMSRRRKAEDENDDAKPVEFVSPLKNEKVIVRFVPHPTAMVDNPKHILYGGMAETSTRSFTVPVLSNGSYVNVLTNEEKKYLEEIMGMEYNGLSVYNKENNYWENYYVKLGKSDTRLDLSDPEDYIKYKVLLANVDYIAPSLEAMQDKPKNTYEYVIVRDEDETNEISKIIDTKQRCYMEFGKMMDSRLTLLTVIRLMEGKVMSRNVKTTVLQGMVHEYIESRPKDFVKVATDPLLTTKGIILRSVEKGVVSQRGDQFFLKDGNIPMCGDNQDPTLSNAARFLNLPKNSGIYSQLQQKIRERD